MGLAAMIDRPLFAAELPACVFHHRHIRTGHLLLDDAPDDLPVAAGESGPDLRQANPLSGELRGDPLHASPHAFVVNQDAAFFTTHSMMSPDIPVIWAPKTVPAMLQAGTWPSPET